MIDTLQEASKAAKMAVDYSAAALLERKYPQVRMIRSYWPMWAAYLYLKKPAEFHTLLFTAMDNTLRSYVKEDPPQVQAASSGRTRSAATICSPTRTASTGRSSSRHSFAGHTDHHLHPPRP